MTNPILWNDFSSWESPVKEFISDIVDQNVIAAFHEEGPDFITDDMSWLESIISSQKNINVDIRQYLLIKITTKFDSIRAFHGSSVSNIQGYIQNGLLLLDIDKSNQAIIHTLQNKYSDINKDDILKAIKNTDNEVRKNRIFFEANKELLIESCGHYFLYGSEYQAAVANQLSQTLNNNIDYRKVLLNRGKPTLFICDIPFSYLSEETLLEICGSLLEVVFKKYRSSSYIHPEMGNSFGLEIERNLEPGYLIDHYHPENVNDPTY